MTKSYEISNEICLWLLEVESQIDLWTGEYRMFENETDKEVAQRWRFIEKYLRQKLKESTPEVVRFGD